MEQLFGGMPDAARFVVAFLLVLGLIGAGAFLWRKFGTGGLSATGSRGRQPRLAVIDAASVDGRRRLVLIRRDNTEHLLMIGGPTDIVIEPNIARAGANTPARDPRPIPLGDIPPRQATPAEAPGWALPPAEPAARPIRSMEDLDPARSEPAPRSAREALADTMRAMRSEPAARATPPAPFRPEPADEITAPALTPPTIPPEPGLHAPAVPEPRRVPVPPVPPPPPPPSYEPVFQNIPEPRRAPTPPAPPPYEPVRASTPPTREPVFQAAPPALEDQQSVLDITLRLQRRALKALLLVRINRSLDLEHDFLLRVGERILVDVDGLRR
jgi:flagellar protein FliO/FliZ